jgi:hypothetical protein
MAPVALLGNRATVSPQGDRLMERSDHTKVAILGAGRGGRALLDLLHQIPSIEIAGERLGAQRVGVSSEESRPAGHRNRDQWAQTILSGNLPRPRCLTGLYRLPQRSPAQPETEL